MKQLLQSSGIHRFVLLIAVTIALGITVHELFLLVAQVIAIAASVYIMIGVFHQSRSVATHGQRRL